MCYEADLARRRKNHFEMLNRFKLQISDHHRTARRPGGQGKAFTESQLPLILQVAIKCADLSNAAAERDIHVRWCKLLEEELFA